MGKIILLFSFISVLIFAYPVSAEDLTLAPPATTTASVTEIRNANIVDLPSNGRFSVAFSPNEGSEDLVVKVINSASQVKSGEILILSYSFTSERITNALLSAIQQGVKVQIVADYRSNVIDDKSGKSQAAFTKLQAAGADVNVIKIYPIHHDKIIIVNRKTVEFGSFNYSDAAAKRNSEHVFVNWDNPELAAVYVKHFERNYHKSIPYVAVTVH